jgi:hypothetical protein
MFVRVGNSYIDEITWAKGLRGGKINQSIDLGGIAWSTCNHALFINFID